MKGRKYWTVIAALVLFSGFVQPSAPQDSVEQDRGVLCDTVEQVEQFAAFDGDGAAAVNAINEKYRTHACAILVVAVVKGKKIKDISFSGQQAELREILVVGWFDGVRWRQLRPFVQYTLYPTGQEGASLAPTLVGWHGANVPESGSI